MKRLMMVAVLAVAQSGCVAAQSDSAVLFNSALAQTGLGASCAVAGDKSVTQGRLDVSGGQNYQLAMRARNTLPAAQSSIVGSTTVTTGGASVVLTEYDYSYQVTPAISGIPADGDDVAATYAVLPSGNVDTVVYLNALGPKLLTRLNTYLQSGDSSVKVSVVSTIKGRGTLGSSHVETNEFSFPVIVFSSGYSGNCPTGQTAGGICNLGQDVPAVCSATATTTP